ncbi:MAG: hypothetical protein JNM94_14285 [Phycisphaerae bacterium]|nr:hypothetical protein [Phycisphaerae bacterium]
MDHKPSLACSLLKLTQDSKTYGTSPLLIELDHKFVERLEQMTGTDKYARDVCRTLQNNLPCGIEDVAHIRQLHNTIAEARIYYDLKDWGIMIERVPQTLTQQPDFQIELAGAQLYAEVKAISMRGGDMKYACIFRDGFDGKLRQESEIKAGTRLSVTEQEIQPVAGIGDAINPHSLHTVIECLIEKLRSLVKPGQLKLGPTVLFCDVNQIGLGCTHREATRPCFVDRDTNTRGSGTLWTTAFGTEGQRVYRPPSFNTGDLASDHDGVLSQDGILRQFPDLAGLVFRSGWSHPEYLGFYRTGAAAAVTALLREVCDRLNNEADSESH